MLLAGIVGLGNVAGRNYAPYLARRKDVQLCYHSRSADKAREYAEKFGGRACASYEEMAGLRPDTVFILSDERYHLDAANELLDRGVKRLFLEKPLTARNGQANVGEQDFTDGIAFLKKAERSGCEVAMNFNYRFFELSRKIDGMIRENGLGQLRQSSWLVHYACWSHCIDLLHWLGGEIEEVTALESKEACGDGPMRAKDIACAFTMANGGSGTILGTSGPDFGHPLYQVTLVFERGRVTFSDLDTRLELHRDGSAFRETWTLNGEGSRWVMYARSFEASIEAYLQSIEKGCPPPVSGLDGLRELQFEAALRRSAAQSRCIVPSKEFPVEL